MSPLSPRRVWVMASLALVLTFVAGALAGAAWERVRARERHDAEREARTQGEVLQHRYGLSDEQTRRVDAILQRRRPRVDSLMSAVRPQLRAASDSTSREIREVMTPSQRRQYDEDRERRRRNLDRWTGPPRQGSAPAAAPAPASP
ncbi:hypothetical protein [Longimicrobium sp.]|uniref:hypothetical protein n=1 Tax=Longimicrobium sp. TaxID=2029185 RepID=UPI002BB05F3F|nr:hypothetical protein [Longimicrobium sp.]HSU17183.1 hypothetical protein [Longimicrobium sp.]